MKKWLLFLTVCCLYIITGIEIVDAAEYTGRVDDSLYPAPYLINNNSKEFEYIGYCIDHDYSEPINKYNSQYDKYNLYDGINRFAKKNVKNNINNIITALFLTSLKDNGYGNYSFFDSNSLKNSYTNSYNYFKNTLMKSASEDYFTQFSLKYNIWNFSDNISIPLEKEAPYIGEVNSISLQHPISKETAYANDFKIVDNNNQELTTESPLLIDPETHLSNIFMIKNYKDWEVQIPDNQNISVIDSNNKKVLSLKENIKYRVLTNRNFDGVENFALSYLYLTNDFLFQPLKNNLSPKPLQQLISGTVKKNIVKIPLKVSDTVVKGEKKWQDYNNKFNTRPNKITINLLKDGQVYKQQEVSKETNWKYQFDHLPLGPTYTITEEPVAKYTSVIVGNDITNTYINTEKVNKTGHKIWDDLNNQYNTRPDHLVFILYQNNKEIDRQTVKPNTSGNWSYAFNNLPKYDTNGNNYRYNVSEVQIGGYSTSTKTDANEINFINKLRLTNVVGEKKWNDLNNQYQYRPQKIIVHLYQNNKEFAKQEVNSQTNWTYSFSNLPLQDKNGKNYVYTVKEDQVPGYESVIDGTTITNNLLLTAIKGEKKWDDQNNAANLRPTQIVVELLQNGTKIQEQVIKPDSTGKWSYTFDNLLKQDQNGKDYVYIVNEQKVPYYTTTIDGTTITNTLKLTEIKGEKQWIDSNDQAGMRPKEITIWLVRNGKRLEKQEIQAGSNNKWTYAFTNLLVNDTDGKVYTYTIEEEPVDNYTTAIDGTTVINTFKPNGILPDTGGRYKQSMIYVGLAIVIVSIISGIVYVTKSIKKI